MYRNMISESYGDYLYPDYVGRFPLKCVRAAIRVGAGLFPAYTKKKLAEWIFRPRVAQRSPNDRLIQQASYIGEVTLPSGVKNTYYLWGEGDPQVLLVHGWESKVSHFKLIIEGLAERGITVLAFDASAHGGSEGVEADLNDFIEAIIALCRRYESIQGAIGYSFGAMALLNAVNLGAPLKKIGVVSAPASFYGIFEKLAAQLRLSPCVREYLSGVIERRYGINEAGWDTYSTYSFAARMEIPLVAVHDKNDTYVLPVESKVLTSLWPCSTLIETENLGHRGILKSKKAVDLLLDELHF